MSKSGLYAHFKSKEDLQVQVLQAAANQFIEVVMTPALRAPRGLPRLRTLFEGWMHWETGALSGGCPFIAASTAFDDVPGAVHDALLGHLHDVMSTLNRAVRTAVQEDHLPADTDTEQAVFELWAALLALHHHSRAMDVPAARTRALRQFDRLVRHPPLLSEASP